MDPSQLICFAKLTILYFCENCSKEVDLFLVDLFIKLRENTILLNLLGKGHLEPLKKSFDKLGIALGLFRLVFLLIFQKSFQ